MIHVYPYEEALITALSNFIISNISKTLQSQERFTLVLSGGNTPKALYRKLASPAWASAIPWEKMHIFWGDERYVPYEEDRNNAKEALETLLNKVKILPFNIHRIRTDVDIKESVKEYDIKLHTYFNSDKTFDLVLLGLGEDGHTLSLFPGSKVLTDQQSWVSAVEDVEPKRITLMPAVVNKASTIIFMVTGKNKSDIFNKVTAPVKDIIAYPAGLIRPIKGEIHWFVDKEVSSPLF